MSICDSNNGVNSLTFDNHVSKHFILDPQKMKFKTTKWQEKMQKIRIFADMKTNFAFRQVQSSVFFFLLTGGYPPVMEIKWEEKKFHKFHETFLNFYDSLQCFFPFQNSKNLFSFWEVERFLTFKSIIHSIYFVSKQCFGKIFKKIWTNFVLLKWDLFFFFSEFFIFCLNKFSHLIFFWIFPVQKNSYTCYRFLSKMKKKTLVQSNAMTSCVCSINSPGSGEQILYLTHASDTHTPLCDDFQTFCLIQFSDHHSETLKKSVRENFGGLLRNPARILPIFTTKSYPEIAMKSTVLNIQENTACKIKNRKWHFWKNSINSLKILILYTMWKNSNCGFLREEMKLWNSQSEVFQIVYKYNIFSVYIEFFQKCHLRSLFCRLCFLVC